MRFKFYFATLLLACLTLVGCESSQTGIDNDGFSTSNTSNPHLGPTASKVFSTDLDVYGSANLEDNDGLTWTLTFLGTQSSANTTTFNYELAKPAGGGGTHLAYRLPTCAGPLVSATPTPTENANANGDIEWGPSAIGSDQTTISLEFNNPETGTPLPLGVADIGLKAPGDGNEQSTTGEIVGPCRGRYSFSGVVFLNDNSPDLEEYNDSWDKDVEPGLGRVEVTLEECYIDCDNDDSWSPDLESEVQETGSDTGTFGTYRFDVVGPPIDNTPSAYRVRITRESTGGINHVLFNPLLAKPACDGALCPHESDDGKVFEFDNNDTIVKVFREYDLHPDSTADYSGVDFGFEIDEAAAIAAFENELLVSDGSDRTYWYVQASQKAKGGYSVDMTLDFQGLLDCSGGNQGGSVDCILGPGDSNDFAGDVDDLIEIIFGGDLTITKAQAILKTDSNGDPQESLRTQILAALLNYVKGRGLCDGSLNGDTCSSFDDAGMRTIIENAIVVLVNSDYSAPTANKASSGSVGSNRELLSQVN